MEIAVNMTIVIVKEHARQFHSPGSATVGAYLPVKIRPKTVGSTINKRKTRSASGLQCWRCGSKHAPVPVAIDHACSSRSLPCALKRKIEEELDRSVQTTVIERERYSNWATPVVPVLKTYGKVRVCGDHKLTVNCV